MTIDEWNHALSQIHIGEHAELEFARTWADSVEVDYDEGPSAIGFTKNGATHWYLIDDVGWDADDPRSEMLAAALEERNTIRSQLTALQAERDELHAELKRVVDIAIDEHDWPARTMLGTDAPSRCVRTLFAAVDAARTERDAAWATLAQYKRATEEQLHYDMKAIISGTPEQRLTTDRDAAVSECEELRALVAEYRAVERLVETRVQGETATAIAGWLDAKSRSDQYEAAYASAWAADIRAGVWRKP